MTRSKLDVRAPNTQRHCQVSVRCVAWRSADAIGSGHRATVASPCLCQHCLASYDHQDVPFERLVEELQSQRQLSYSPLFQVAFSLDPGTPPIVTEGRTRAEVLETTSGQIPFDLVLSLTDDGETIRGALRYQRDLFRSSTIRTVVKDWRAILELLVSAPQTRICDGAAVSLLAKPHKSDVSDVDMLSEPRFAFESVEG